MYMDNFEQTPQRQPNPRRRKRDPKRIFMESYLPVILFGGVILLIIVAVISGCISNKQRQEDALKESIAQLEEDEERKAAMRQEADICIAEAKAVAATYDFEAAIAVLDAFEGNIFDYDDMLQLRDSYKHTMENLVEFTPDQVVNLSIPLLIADADRAFADKNYGGGYKKNFITTEEFYNLLVELYNNGYVLVSMDDLVAETGSAGAITYSTKTVALPEGKKPLMLTETQVNYYTYMVDPDNDGVPDKNGAGFASKLILQGDTFLNEMVTADGETVTGNFDIVPILEDFLQMHPDFSYQGARAILAVTGYNGIFGYRGDTLEDVVPLLEELRSRGYTIAFHSFANTDYKASNLVEITTDLERWEKRIIPTLGETNMLVYARATDIAAPGTYSGDKFNLLQSHGFRYYVGYCTDNQPWFVCEKNYVRQGRIPVSAINMKDNPSLYEGIFDPTNVLVETR